MAYKSTEECIKALEDANQLIRIKCEVDPYLEMAEIQRRIYSLAGPAILFENIKGCSFQAVSNIYGSLDRTNLIFKKSIKATRLTMEAWSEPIQVLKRPLDWWKMLKSVYNALPKKINICYKKKASMIPVMACQCDISDLPQIHSWPLDGGSFITLPQVLTRDPDNQSIMNTNLGMYRIQMSGNEYVVDEEVGLHYQIHRGIGIHHTKAIEKGEDLKVSIFVGGPPAHAVAAMMPTPEGMSETLFAGMLGGHRFKYTEENGWIIAAEADFCILGTIAADTKPEGPFGDHLGYHSLKHLFPYLKIEKVYHRKNAIWPFTVVGRPPQEDTSFGQLVHSLTSKILPSQIPGVKSVHAVDAAGVHSLLLVVGSERYIPYERREPREILSQANALLGYNQISLAKYLFICASEDNPDLDPSEIEKYLKHVLARVDFTRDLHFQTSTTMDTLDYTGTSLNRGSKLVIASAGKPIRRLAKVVPNFNTPLAEGFFDYSLAFDGVLLINTEIFVSYDRVDQEIESLNQWALSEKESLKEIAWIILVDDKNFCSKNISNLLWVTFLRSNPSHDIHGIDSFFKHKHWGCNGPMITDARIKPHHAPLLEITPEVKSKVDLIIDELKL